MVSGGQELLQEYALKKLEVVKSEKSEAETVQSNSEVSASSPFFPFFSSSFFLLAAMTSSILRIIAEASKLDFSA
jgi:hypothetical protein